MGDFADMAAEQCMMQEVDGYLLDTRRHVNLRNKKFVDRPCGKGLCPKCGSKTRLIEGKFGYFYGCIKFPDCKGSRNE